MNAYPFSRDSDPVGQGRLTGPEIDLSFDARAAGIGQQLIDACQRLRLSDGRTLDHDVAAGQSHLETGGGTSEIFLRKNNVGGVGATNADPFGTAHSYPTRQAGVDAYIAHLVVYNDPSPSAEIIALDGRYQAAKSEGFVGIVQREDKALYEYEQRYAHTYPQPAYDNAPLNLRYGAKVAGRVNQMYRKAGRDQLVPPVPPAGRVAKPPMNLSRRSPNHGGYPTPRRIEAICSHIGQGTSLSNLSWLTNPASGASCNYLIAENGEIFEIVPPSKSPWTNGQVNKPDLSNALIKGWVAAGINPNTRTLTIEHAGFSAYNRGGALNPAQWAATIWLQAWLTQEYVLPVDRGHLIGHYQIDSVDRSYCPGWSPDEWDTLLAGIVAMQGGAPPEPADDPNVLAAPTGHFIVNAHVEGRWINMLDRWIARGGVAVCGWPQGGMFGFDEPLPDGSTQRTFRQRFDNLGLSIYPDNSDRFYGVVMELIAAEARISELEAASPTP